jgi:hypothetical protein
VKEWTISAAVIALLALAIGLLFHWIYPTVELTMELAGLFGFIALFLRLIAGRLAAWVRRPRTPTGPETEP